MNCFVKKYCIVMVFLMFKFIGYSQNNLSINNILNKTEISGKWYLLYKYDFEGNINSFALKRGYITLKSKLNDIISVRYTQDITIDNEGFDAGNVEIRMKYMYLMLRPFKNGIMKNSFTEFGLVHRPFVDFEQHINAYRSQGKMFIEKTGIVNTADFGILYSGLLGGKLSENSLKRTGKNMPGKYGSFAIGVYNGGGYHNFEENNNKTIEGRLSLRPLPELLPGIQLSYAGIYGKGNIANSPDFTCNLAALTYENNHIILTLQYYFGRGDYQGKYFDAYGNSAFNKGYSFFGEFLIPKTSFAVFGRYDNFVSNQIMDYFEGGYFAGLTYRFLKNKVFVCYEQDKIGNEKKKMFELVLDVVF